MLYWLATSKVPSGNGFLNTSYHLISLPSQDDKSIIGIETLLSLHPHLSKVLDISLHQESGVWPRFPSAAKPLWLFLSERAFVVGNLVYSMYWSLQPLHSLKYGTSYHDHLRKSSVTSLFPHWYQSLSVLGFNPGCRSTSVGVLLMQFASRLHISFVNAVVLFSAESAIAPHCLPGVPFQR